MPLLPQTREALGEGHLAQVEDHLDHLVTEVGHIVDTGVEYMARLRDHRPRLHRIRNGFDAARRITAPE